MSEVWNIAVLGATGAVGRALVELMQERNFPVGQLFLLAGEESAGKSVRFSGRSLKVESAEQFDWSQVQIAFFMAGSEIAARYVRAATETGCVVIDNSGLFALHHDIPLVIPGINPQALVHYRNHNIVAVAHSLTSQLLSAVKPLVDNFGLARLQVTSLLSVSAYGKAAVEDLAGQSARLLNGISPEPGFFPRQVAFNLLPLRPDEAGSVREERQLIEEVRKILQIPDLPITASSVQAPVFYGHTQIVQLQGEQPLSASEARALWQQQSDIVVSEEDSYPTPVEDAAESYHLSIGCIGHDYGMPQMLQFWSVADNIRFGGALMALETAEKLVQEYY
ncbi:MAG: aspartate-semialdehyde dehydrogenase [Enterobacteriaceae bacterium]